MRDYMNRVIRGLLQSFDNIYYSIEKALAEVTFRKGQT